MGEITQEVNIEIVEKLPDGNYKRKNPRTIASQVEGYNADDILNKLLTIPGFDMSSFTKAVTGSYVGDGEYTRDIILGYKPKFIFVRDSEIGATKAKAWISMEGHGVYFKNQTYPVAGGGSATDQVRITSNGIKVNHSNGAEYSQNETGKTYRYVAIV